VTLQDAVVVIRDLEPFRQARPVWDRAAEMIMERAAIAEAKTAVALVGRAAA
jgi:hypothetical protein